jgi:hypothetical protein
MRNMGHGPDEVEDRLSTLAEERRDDDIDRELEQRLIARGYDLEQLERDNPYNSWMVA